MKTGTQFSMCIIQVVTAVKPFASSNVLNVGLARPFRTELGSLRRDFKHVVALASKAIQSRHMVSLIRPVYGKYMTAFR